MIILNAILPVFLVIAAGYFIRKKVLPDLIFWQKLDWLIYYVLMPLMMIRVLANAPFSLDMIKIGFVIMGAIFTTSLLSMTTRLSSKIDDASFTSVFQGAVRCNFYIALSIASIMFGDAGVHLLSFILLFLIFSGVTPSILILQRYGEKPEDQKPRNVFQTLTYNPVIIAMLIGVGIGGFVDKLPVILDETLNIFGRATLPLALLGVGASVRIKDIKCMALPVILSCSFGLIFSPILGIGLAHYLELSQMETICCALILGVPAAASTITFASQMGGNVRLMSSILTVQTIMSLITLSCFIYYLGS